MIAIIDNYDSFTYNLYQLAGVINPDVSVFKNDVITPEELEKLNPSHIIISPGPGRPKDAGNSEKIIAHFKGKVPILGVCLGHQAICEVFGGKITYAKEVLHGKKSVVHIANGSPIFYGLPPVLEVGRYHSLAAARESLPEELLITAETDDGEVMAVKHREYDIYGVQFHPETILTQFGDRIMENFLGITNG
ncbi:MAG: aminodeoxychorismate/anthranilate synthase component II [Oscillospiraceae bacterium]|nr:aminodeoxychorismate/anthranilate synthase component II [Oscillospiraceae bacterium]